MKKYEDYCSDTQYAVSIKEDTAYMCLHFTKDHEGNKINTPYLENPIRRIQAMEIKYSGRYRTWSLLQETPNTPLHKGKSVVGAFMNAPIFVGTFSVVTDFAVIEDMDRYRDEEMGDVIVGKEFCKEIGIPPLLKMSKDDMMNGISHSYQKLKGFYKGVLNLGPDFIRDPSMEEWLTRRHVSVDEMEW
ncbi:hypothetical protein Tco_0896728 [Tanacetum coccineum]